MDFFFEPRGIAVIGATPNPLKGGNAILKNLLLGYRGGSALIVRIHHSYADGMALVRVMLSMTDAGRDGPPAMPFNPPKRKARADDDSALAALITPMSGVMKTAMQVGSLLTVLLPPLILTGR